MIGIALSLSGFRPVVGSGPEYTPDLEITWDDGDYLAWDDGSYVAWD